MDIKKRLIRTAILALVGLTIGGSIAYMQVKSEEGQVAGRGQKSKPASMPGISLGGPFTLTNHDGQTVTEKDFEDGYRLIYFGFTYCPAICPTELQKIVQVLKSMDEAEAAKIQPIFISVDPERDTVAVMKDYVGLFHPKLIGLTGTTAQIEDIKKSYKVFSAKVPTEDGSDYTVDHSSFIYFMAPENKVLGIYRMQDDVEYILKDMRDLMKNAA